MTDEQIWQLIYGANSKDVETLEDKDEKKLDPTMKKMVEQKENVEEFVTKDQFMRILKRDLNEEKKNEKGKKLSSLMKFVIFLHFFHSKNFFMLFLL